MKCCAVIPCFNNASTLDSVVSGVRRFVKHVIVVDDGSTDGGVSSVTPFDTLVVRSHEQNRGKGAAVKTGIEQARKLGFTHVLQIDADGQHDLEDIPVFLRAAAEQPDAVIAGERLPDETMPRLSRIGRRFGLFWYRLETGGHGLEDTQCGFRVYPCSLFDRIRVSGNRMDFDVEILVRAVWDRTPVIGVPTRVRYFSGDRRVSHFRPVRDNLLFAAMNARLLPIAMKRGIMDGKAEKEGQSERGPAWYEMREQGSRLGIRLTFWVLRFLGYRAARLLVYPITWYFILASSDVRRWIRVFQMRAVGSASTLTCARTLRNFAFSILDRAFVFMGKSDRFRWTIHGRETLAKWRDKGRGAIILGAHLGTLELGPALTGEELGIRVGMLMYEARSSKLYQEFERLNPGLKQGMIQMGSDPIGPMIEMRRRYGQGEFIGILGDRKWRDGATTSLDFLGKAHDFPVGPYRIAALLHAPILMVILVKEGIDHYHMFVEELCPPVSGQAGKDDAVTLAALYAGRLEDYARRFPYQWYNLYDFWNESGQNQRPSD